MIWHNWNKADKTLLAAGVIFLFTLCLHVQYPTNVFADCLLFCAEAALVGGIADWFAVTALFRKPLGFPYHTAILPRRRKEFTEATGKMLQREFFSKKKLLSKARSIDYAGKLSSWLTNENNVQVVSRFLQKLCEKNMHGAKVNVADGLIQGINSESFAKILYDRIEKISETDNIGTTLVKELFPKAKAYASQDSFRDMIEEYLERFKEEKTNNPMVKMMAGLAEATDLINIAQAADIIQEQCIKLIDQLEKPDSEEGMTVLSSVNNTLKNFLNNEDFKKDFLSVWSNSERGDFYIRDAVMAIDFSNDERAGSLLYCLSCCIVKMFREALSGNQRIRHLFNESIYQITGRGALQAQEMLGDVTRDVMGSLTDEQMNHLIYDKAEPDLLWIRMNGSIVGAVIGLCIFVASIIIEGKVC